MTTWQEEPPMSRRALRESERAHAQATMSRTDGAGTEEEGADQQIWVQPPGPEPLHYTTQVRPQMPHYDGQSFRARKGDDAPASADAPAYRLRDFSPEARGTSFTATQPTPSAAWAPPSTGSGDLDYHTSVEAARPAPTAYSAPDSAPPKLGTPEPAPAREEPPRVDPQDGPHDRTMTRREMRALRDAAASAVGHQPLESLAPAPSESVIASPPVPLVEPEAAPVVDEAPAETPLPLVAPRPDPSPEVAAAMAEFDALYLRRIQQEATPEQVVGVVPEAVAAAEIVSDETPVAEDVEDLHTLVEPTVSEPIPSIAVIPSPPAAPPVEDAPIREVVTAPEVHTKPIGHWSTQAGIDDQNQVVDHTLSRDLAASDAITTSALVLPNFPQSGPFTGPVSSTGEILITGSIDLPRSLGMSGRYPSRYDSSDVDAIIDGTDREDAAPDSAPVRAIRAVSTHTSSQGIIATKRPKGNNLPVILSITAGVMAVSVVVLFVAGMIFKIF